MFDLIIGAVNVLSVQSGSSHKMVYRSHHWVLPHPSHLYCHAGYEQLCIDVKANAQQRCALPILADQISVRMCLAVLHNCKYRRSLDHIVSSLEVMLYLAVQQAHNHLDVMPRCPLHQQGARSTPMRWLYLQQHVRINFLTG
jgi:hypothetical protein